MNSSENSGASAPLAVGTGSEIFAVFHRPTGKTFGSADFWGDNADGKKHLESHLLIGPTGRVFWYQHDGLREITAECDLTLFPNTGDERRSPERPAAPSVPHTTENPQR